MGQAAIRWLTIRWDTTTSQSEKSATRLRASIDQITFDSACSNSLGPPSRDASGSTSAESGS